MRFYTEQHKYYCGIDLHARSMYLCILDQEGTVLLHRNLRGNPGAFLKAVAKYREDLVVAVAGRRFQRTRRVQLSEFLNGENPEPGTAPGFLADNPKPSTAWLPSRTNAIKKFCQDDPIACAGANSEPRERPSGYRAIWRRNDLSACDIAGYTTGAAPVSAPEPRFPSSMSRLLSSMYAYPRQCHAYSHRCHAYSRRCNAYSHRCHAYSRRE